MAGLVLVGCGSDSSSGPAADKPSGPDAGAPPAVTPGESALVLTFGPDVLPAVKARIEELVGGASPLPVRSLDANAAPPTLAADAVVLSFGRTATEKPLVDDVALAKLGSEGIVLKSGRLPSGALELVAVGNDPDKATVDHGNLGTAFAAYALLEQLGFAFLHPLAPTIPAKLAIPKDPIDVSESPEWRIRGMHLHTMHPLELTDMLEGWGPNGTDDEAGWQAQLPEWDRFLEWMLANRQNRVEWLILWAKTWSDFADGSARQKRLATLVDHVHAHGIGAGVDAALAEEQQHMFHLVRQTGTTDSETQQIHQYLDYLFGAGFDFFSTESGTTEFTHPDPAKMLAWMNEAAQYSKSAHNAPSYIKAHCSTGQTADGYPDPKTGDPINFNFLPHYADKRLGVMPHTVEMYGFDDPAPTYGNTDFRYMKDFLQQEVNKREVVWHPETAYWITFDIDVPLFLPIYAERRVSDLRSLLADERAGKAGKMDGQMIFSSGWEWGYWLNDVVTARAAWNPHIEATSDRAALLAVLAPITRALGSDVTTWIADTADAEANLLILGAYGSGLPSDITKRNGMAYLEGFDAMADVASLGGVLGLSFSPITQPQKLGLLELKNSPFQTNPTYDELQPLLAGMETQLGALADRTKSFASPAPQAADLLDDLVDASRITALRAKQVHGLYDYAAGKSYVGNDSVAWSARLTTAQGALDDAAKIVAAREKRYRVPADRIAGWRSGPTAYDFTYLWPARSLYFWWRDEAKVIESPISPCFRNIMNPADIALGEGMVADVAQVIRDRVGGSISECLAPPSSEPHYSR